MSGVEVRSTRERLGLTQMQAARRWRVSQTYLSLMEHGKRRVPDRLARQLAHAEPSLATALPLEPPPGKPVDLPKALGTLGYPGFAYLADPRVVTNPAAVVLAALQAPHAAARVTEAIPWVLATFVDLDWNWLVDRSKLANLQNRLGYLVMLAREVSEQKNDSAASKLSVVERRLDEAKLAKEDTLGRELTDVERTHLRQHRPEGAAHWNLLTSLQSKDLRYVA